MRRALAVDALRGLAILGMVLVAVEPLGSLPAWMYHAQQPPPAHELNTDLPGLTWPDLVFPVFIFTLGAAIPLALAKRLERGAGLAEIVGGALTRGGLLVFFALFRQHFDSSLYLLQPERTAWLVGLAAFAVLFLIFTRFPDTWGRGRRLSLRAAGWVGAVTMFAVVRFPDGTRFMPQRIDIILLLLAYCALFGTLVWLLTRGNLLGRLAILAAVASFRLVGYNPGWVNVVYAFDPVPWLYKFSFFQFLCVVIPGTIAGDMLVAWMRQPDAGADARQEQWTTGRTVGLALLLVLVLPVVLIGVQMRHVFVTTALTAVLSAAALALVRRPSTPTESLIAGLVRWGAFWLLFGLLMDPFDGGTKKVPETFAWFFQGAGIAALLLVVFFLIIEVWRRPRSVQLLVDNGQNPMIAYVANGMLILPLLGLTTIKAAIDARELSGWLLFSWSVLLTVGLAFVVRFFTRRKLFWSS